MTQVYQNSAEWPFPLWQGPCPQDEVDVESLEVVNPRLVDPSKYRSSRIIFNSCVFQEFSSKNLSAKLTPDKITDISSQVKQFDEIFSWLGSLMDLYDYIYEDTNVLNFISKILDDTFLLGRLETMEVTIIPQLIIHKLLPFRLNLIMVLSLDDTTERVANVKNMWKKVVSSITDITNLFERIKEMSGEVDVDKEEMPSYLSDDKAGPLVEEQRDPEVEEISDDEGTATPKILLNLQTTLNKNKSDLYKLIFSNKEINMDMFLYKDMSTGDLEKKSVKIVRQEEGEEIQEGCLIINEDDTENDIVDKVMEYISSYVETDSCVHLEIEIFSSIPSEPRPKTISISSTSDNEVTESSNNQPNVASVSEILENFKSNGAAFLIRCLDLSDVIRDQMDVIVDEVDLILAKYIKDEYQTLPHSAPKTFEDYEALQGTLQAIKGKDTLATILNRLQAPRVLIEGVDVGTLCNTEEVGQRVVDVAAENIVFCERELACPDCKRGDQWEEIGGTGFIDPRAIGAVKYECEEDEEGNSYVFGYAPEVLDVTYVHPKTVGVSVLYMNKASHRCLTNKFFFTLQIICEIMNKIIYYIRYGFYNCVSATKYMFAVISYFIKELKDKAQLFIHKNPIIFVKIIESMMLIIIGLSLLLIL